MFCVKKQIESFKVLLNNLIEIKGIPLKTFLQTERK